MLSQVKFPTLNIDGKREKHKKGWKIWIIVDGTYCGWLTVLKKLKYIFLETSFARLKHY